jgi:putative MATE family efflux protein
MAKTKMRMDITDERISPVKVILWLAWPLFVEQILGTLVSYADTAMVGALGVQATAAVSISNPFVFLINGAVMALGVGITAYVARMVGAKNYEAAKAYIRHALIVLVGVGLPLSIITLLLHRQIPQWMGAEPEILDHAANYVLITSIFRIFSMGMMMLSSVFRGRGDTKTPLRINIAVNILNVVGNYLLINPCHTIRLGSLSIPMIGAGLGVEGAAISTGFSWFIGGTVMAIMLFVKDDPTRISLKESYRPDFKLLKGVIQVSVPAMLERICMSTAGIIVTKSIASLGTVVVAANTVYLTAESISYMPAFAFATAATTLVGQALGAGKPALAVKYTKLTCGIGAAIMAFAGSMLYIFARQLVSIFTDNAEAIAIAINCMHIVAFLQAPQALAWILAGALRGAGDTKWPFYITAFCTWFIRTLGAWLCIRVFGWGLPEAVMCMFADGCVRAVLTFLRFRTGKWQHAIKDRPAQA